jgi:hypothetical protein
VPEAGCRRVSPQGVLSPPARSMWPCPAVLNTTCTHVTGRMPVANADSPMESASAANL